MCCIGVQFAIYCSWINNYIMCYCMRLLLEYHLSWYCRNCVFVILTECKKLVIWNLDINACIWWDSGLSNVWMDISLLSFRVIVLLSNGEVLRVCIIKPKKTWLWNWGNLVIVLVQLARSSGVIYLSWFLREIRFMYIYQKGKV